MRGASHEKASALLGAGFFIRFFCVGEKLIRRGFSGSPRRGALKCKKQALHKRGSRFLLSEDFKDQKSSMPFRMLLIRLGYQSLPTG